jgi:DNA-binding NarL/FixJ family response regulator
MTADLRVLICSSSAAVTAGIESVLRGAAADGRRMATSQIHRYGDVAPRTGLVEPHVVVLHGLDLEQAVAWSRWRRIPVVLAVEGICRGSDILRVVRAGVVCLVAIDTDLPALGPACAGAAAGRPYLSPPLLHELLAYLAGRDDPGTSTRMGLTARESQVLRHLAVGRSQADISRILRISTRTVKHHLGNVYRKLGVHSQTEAIVQAYRGGLVA